MSDHFLFPPQTRKVMCLSLLSWPHTSHQGRLVITCEPPPPRGWGSWEEGGPRNKSGLGENGFGAGAESGAAARRGLGFPWVRRNNENAPAEVYWQLRVIMAQHATQNLSICWSLFSWLTDSIFPWCSSYPSTLPSQLCRNHYTREGSPLLSDWSSL